MKKIVINGRRFEYEVFCDASEYGECYWTEFYEGTIRFYKKKYRIFGPMIECEVPNFIFEVPFDIEDVNITKSELREKLVRAVKILDRAKEIERGELI